MIKKINTWMSKPITWKGMIKAYGIISGVMILLSYITYVCIGICENPVNMIKRIFKKKESGKEEEEA